jgi:hypothetical protein
VLGRKLPNPSYDGKFLDEEAREAEELAEDRALESQAGLSETEKEALRKYRCGQGLFRDRVAALEPHCRITGVNVKVLLRASHIKPWKDSTDKERLDGNNGLLLAPHVDHLFDQGYISFTNGGGVRISPKCPRHVLTAWGISPRMKVGPFRKAQWPFLGLPPTQVRIQNLTNKASAVARDLRIAGYRVRMATNSPSRTPRGLRLCVYRVGPLSLRTRE